MGIDSIGFGVRIHGMSIKVNPPVPIGPGLEHPRTTSAEAGSLPGALPEVGRSVMETDIRTGIHVY